MGKRVPKTKYTGARSAEKRAPGLPKNAPLSEGQIRAFADMVLNCEAHPEDAKTMLKEFLRVARPGGVVSDAMIGFLSEAIERFMDGECSLMEALGLSRPPPRGRPKTAQGIAVAAHVLLARVRGAKSTDAELDATEKFGLESTGYVRTLVLRFRYEAIRSIRNRSRELKLGTVEVAKLDQLARVKLRPRWRNPLRNRLAGIPPQ